MLITPHVAAGALIGTSLKNPLYIIPVSFASHFILDAVPHWQETLYPYKPNKLTYPRIFIDLILSLALIIYVISKHGDLTEQIILGSFFSVLPDFDSFLAYYPNLLKDNRYISIWWNFHCKIQNETSSLFGLIPQIIIILLSVCLFILT